MKYEDALKIVDTHNTDGDFWSTVKKAVEKQIPRKPIVSKEEGPRGLIFSEFSCPVCNNTFEEDFILNEYGHCDYCGQAIDWSEVE